MLCVFVCVCNAISNSIDVSYRSGTHGHVSPPGTVVHIQLRRYVRGWNICIVRRLSEILDMQR